MRLRVKNKNLKIKIKESFLRDSKIFIFYLLIFILFLTGCGKKKAAIVRPAALVTACETISKDVPVYIDEIGSATASESVSIRPQASGQITEINFIDGADLKKGDALFTIDPRPYQAALQQAQASLAQSQAALSLAKSEFERAKGLLPSGAVSKDSYEIKQNDVVVKEAVVQSCKAAVQTAQVNLDYCFIRSPIDGRAGKRQVDIGNVVTANSGDVLLTIQRLNPIYADFTITERDLSYVREEMTKDDLETYVRLPDEPDANASKGKLTFLDNAVQGETGTVKLRATLSNANHHFWPGQFVQVRLVLRTIKNAVLAPYEAVQTSQNGPYVYVVKPDSTAELRLVKLGQQQDKMIVISEGLKAGEKVITSGQLTVTPGGKVQIASAAPEQKTQQQQQTNKIIKQTEGK